ncbi:MAG: ubiquitin-like protein Pup [Candidatus Tectimicrobiota bacterium]
MSAWATGGQDQRQRRRARQDTAPPSSAQSVSAKGNKLKEDLDGLIEQIDEVLEENAEEFVRNYIQRGGQ